MFNVIYLEDSLDFMDKEITIDQFDTLIEANKYIKEEKLDINNYYLIEGTDIT